MASLSITIVNDVDTVFNNTCTAVSSKVSLLLLLLLLLIVGGPSKK
jgi:hypothetical protein